MIAFIFDKHELQMGNTHTHTHTTRGLWEDQAENKTVFGLRIL